QTSDPMDILIELLADGAVSEVFTFTLLPTPSTGGNPGALTRRWVGSGAELLANTEPVLTDLLVRLDVGLTDEERAVLHALLRLAKARFAQVAALLPPIL